MSDKAISDWWSDKIKDGFEQGVSAEFCAWQEVKCLRARVAELEAALNELTEWARDVEISDCPIQTKAKDEMIERMQATLEGK